MHHGQKSNPSKIISKIFSKTSLILAAQLHPKVAEILVTDFESSWGATI